MPPMVRETRKSEELERVNAHHAELREQAQRKWVEFQAKADEFAESGASDAEREAQRLHGEYGELCREIDQVKVGRETLWADLAGGGSGRRGRSSRVEGGKWLAAAITQWKRTAGGVDSGHFGAETVAVIGSGSGLGDAITPPQHADFWFDLLEARSVGLLAGFTVLTTDKGELKVPRVSADATATWVAEGDVIAASDPTGDLVTFKPEQIAARAVINRSAFVDSVPAALAITEASMVRQTSLGVDRGFLVGSGVGAEILGISNTPGVQTLDLATNGAELVNLDPFAEGIGLLEEANAMATAIFMAPRDWKALLKLKEDSTDSIKPLLEQTGGGTEGVKRSIYGVPVYLTSQIPTDDDHGTATNASRAIVCEAAQVVAVQREDVELAVDPYYDFDRAQVGVRTIARWDVGLPNPEAVVVVEGIIPPAA